MSKIFTKQISKKCIAVVVALLPLLSFGQSVLVQYDAVNYNTTFNALSPSCTSTLTSSYSNLGVSALSTSPYGYCPGRFGTCGYFQITAASQPGYAYCNSATPSLVTTPDFISFTVTPSASNCVYVNTFYITMGTYGTATSHGADQVLVGYSTDGGVTWVTGPIFSITPSKTGGGSVGTQNASCNPIAATAPGNGCATMTTYTWNMTPFSTLTPVIFKIIPFDATKCDCTNGANGNDEWAMTQVEVDGVAAPPPTITVNSPTICVGSAASVLASSGGTAVSYTWNTGSTSNPLSVSPTTNTTYTVTGTSASGCTATATGSVTVNTLPTVTASSSSMCPGATASIVASSGTATSYSWNTGANTATLTASPTSTTPYTVTGTDGNGCKNTATGTITVNPTPAVTVNSTTLCAGGTATLTANCGTAISYSWNTGVTAATITVSPTVNTNYSVTVTNSSGCTGTAVGSVTVNPSILLTVPSTSICQGATGTLTASGANTYTWSANAGGATTASIAESPTVTTTYSVTGTSSAGCVASGTGTITVNSLPTITATSTPICIGNTGTLTANSSTATSYSWSTGATTNSITASPTSNTSYTVTGTDANGCKNNAVGTLTVNPLPTISAPGITACPGTTATLTASGSATSYTWSANAGSATTASVVVTPTVSPTDYTVSGTDGNGCVNTTTTSVTLSTNSPLTVTTSFASVACLNTTYTLTASGASANTYTWTASNGVPISSNANTITVTPTTTVSVTYSVSGSLGGGCTTSPTSTVVNVVAPKPINVTPNPSGTVCIGSTVTVSVSGANTYTWSANAGGVNTSSITTTPPSSTTYTVWGTDANGCPDTAYVPVTVNPLPVIQAVSQPVCPNSTATLTAVPSTTTSIASYTWSTGANASTTTVSVGTTSQGYTVTVTDVNGCVSVPVTDSVIVNSHPTITSLSATKPIACVGVADTITAQGASTYTWVANGVTLSNNTNQIIVTPSVVTHYTVTGTLSGGCMTVPDTISITIDAPISFSITASPSPSVCPGNTVSLSGTPTTYTYTWGGGITNGVAFTPTASATYTVMATDANGCTSAVNNEPVTVFTTTVITISPSSSPVCIGAAQGSTTLTATPSTLSSYTWSTGAVTSTPSIVVTPTANPTTYSVSVTDGNGCMDSTATPLSLPVYTPAPLIITAIGGNTVCSNATTTLTANNGGTSTYTWMPSVTSVSANSNSVTITPTNPTTYSVIGIDANGCVDTASKQIDIVPIPSSLSVTPNNYICSNNPVNSMVVTATNATGYIWVGPAPSTNTVSTSSTPSFTTPGMYTVYAVNSCGQLSAGSTVPLTKDSVTAAITAPTGTLTTGNAPDTVSFAGLGTSTNGIISNTSYNWNFGNGNSSSTQNPTEIYTAPSLIQNIYTATLTVTDSKGCWDTATVKITVNEIPTMIIIPNIFSPNGDGINDVFSIKATGISDFDCKIYDRWGILLHEWTGIDGGWDGKGKNGNNETDGTYFYIINYNDINNKTINKTGFFELVR
jgi:gliding motility-associated-like protein